MPTFYRVVRSSPPMREDFLGDRERGRPEPADARLLRLMDGLSVFDSVDRARRKAVHYPALGSLIAAVEVPGDDDRFRFERTTTGRGHYTLWGDPAALQTLVAWVVPVESGSR